MNYKLKAKQFYMAVNEYDIAEVKKMLRYDYIQHNPFIPTGRKAFLDFIPELKQNSTKIQNLVMFQDREYVIMLHLWKNAYPFGYEEALAFHIIRFDSDDLIAEHWNVMQDKSQVDSLSYLPTPINLKLHSLFQENNFKLYINEVSYTDRKLCVYELKRIQEFVEIDQIRIYQEIPKKNLANSNTMFDFTPSPSL